MTNMTKKKNTRRLSIAQIALLTSETSRWDIYFRINVSQNVTQYDADDWIWLKHDCDKKITEWYSALVLP